MARLNQHTAGPWHLEKPFVRGMLASITAAPGPDGKTRLILAHVDVVDGFADQLPGTSNANAALLRSAPRLLDEALRAAALVKRILATNPDSLPFRLLADAEVLGVRLSAVIAAARTPVDHVVPKVEPDAGCDCEHVRCEHSTRAAACGEPATVRATVLGIETNLCSGCLASYSALPPWEVRR